MADKNTLLNGSTHAETFDQNNIRNNSMLSGLTSLKSKESEWGIRIRNQSSSQG